MQATRSRSPQAARLRVAFDVSSLYRRYRTHSGIPRFVNCLHNALVESGEIDVLPFVNCTELGNRLDRDAVRRASSQDAVAAVFRSGRNRGLDLYTQPPDVVHSTFYPPPEALLRVGAPWVATVHDFRPIDDPSSVERRHTELFRRMRDVVVQDASVVHCVSESTAARARSVWGIANSRIRVIYPALPDIPDHGIEKRDEGDKHRPYVLFLGTVQPAKGIDTAIAAFARLVESYGFGGFRLVVAGSDVGCEPQSDTWRKMEDDGRVTRLKRVNDVTRLALIAAAEAVLCTSHYEGFGFVPLEAVAVGSLPVVSTAHPCLEVMKGWPYIFKPNDAVQCAEVVATALRHPERSRDAVAASANEVMKWRWRDVAAACVRLYSEVYWR